MNEKKIENGQCVDEMSTAANAYDANFFPAALGTTERRKLAHELRTSFGAILTRVDVLLHTDMNGHAEIHRNAYLEEIRIAANHALEVIETTTSEPSGEANDMLPLTDLYDNVQCAFVLVGMQAQDAGVKISIDNLDERIFVRVKPSTLRQILLNILVNAIKFTPTDGRVDIGFLTTERSCTIIIRDNGIGIAPGELTRIKHVCSGRGGYGYNIAHSLAIACGAELSIESQRNVGTTVSVTFSTAF